VLDPQKGRLARREAEQVLLLLGMVVYDGEEKGKTSFKPSMKETDSQKFTLRFGAMFNLTSPKVASVKQKKEEEESSLKVNKSVEQGLNLSIS
jgi:hypothetical protein